MKPNFDSIPPGVSYETHRRSMPHWQQTGRMYFLTWRLGDSLPRHRLEQLRRQKSIWLEHNPKPWDSATKAEYYQLYENKRQEWLDLGSGSCLLRDPALRHIVSQCLTHFDGQRYLLDSFVVMPNHVHVLVMPLEENTIPQITHSWKSFSASAINKALQRTGKLWMREGFDHLVRSWEHLQKFRRYIQNNPVKAGLSGNEFTLYLGSRIDRERG